MSLRFDLGPFEKLYVGKSVLTNGGDRTTFIVEGDSPILRARDVLRPEGAISPLEKLYRCVQQMYLEEDSSKYRPSYGPLLAHAISHHPEHYGELRSADQQVLRGHRYQALKTLKGLIKQEAFQPRKAETSGRVVRRAAG